MYKPLVSSGLAFGAKRWVATLERQCERLASAMANNIQTGDVGSNLDKSLNLVGKFNVLLIVNHL